MRSRIQKWGNSLALRIPHGMASELGLTTESPVDLTMEGGRLEVTPVRTPGFDLEKLLAGIREDNLHGEADFGEPVGREEW